MPAQNCSTCEKDLLANTRTTYGDGRVRAITDAAHRQFFFTKIIELEAECLPRAGSGAAIRHSWTFAENSNQNSKAASTARRPSGRISMRQAENTIEAVAFARDIGTPLNARVRRGFDLVGVASKKCSAVWRTGA